MGCHSLRVGIDIESVPSQRSLDSRSHVPNKAAVMSEMKLIDIWVYVCQS